MPLISSILLLTACGGTEEMESLNSPSPEEQARVFANGLTTASTALAEGNTLTARKMMIVSNSWDDSDTKNITAVDSSATVRMGENGELIATVNGNEVVFADADKYVEADGRVYGYEKDGDVYYSIWSQTGEISDLTDSDGDFAEAVELYFDEGDSFLFGYAVFGAETPASGIPTRLSASFSGQAKMNLRPATGFTSGSVSRSRLYSDATLNIDFENEIVSGDIDNLLLRAPGQDYDDASDRAGKILLNETEISASGFHGTLLADTAATDSLDITGLDGGYSGVFFGPAAEQIGLTLEAEVSSTEGTELGIGGGVLSR